MPDAGCHDQRRSRPSQRDDFFDTVEHGRVVGDVAVDVAHYSKRQEDAPVVWLVDQLRCDVLESASRRYGGQSRPWTTWYGKL